jgi:hypothetical protein
VRKEEDRVGTERLYTRRCKCNGNFLKKRQAMVKGRREWRNPIESQGLEHTVGLEKKGKEGVEYKQVITTI